MYFGAVHSRGVFKINSLEDVFKKASADRSSITSKNANHMRSMNTPSDLHSQMTVDKMGPCKIEEKDQKLEIYQCSNQWLKNKTY